MNLLTKSGMHRTGPNTRSMHLIICGGGGGGAASQFEKIDGANGDPGQTIDAHVNVEPDTEYAFVIGDGGAGGTGLDGAHDGDASIFHLGALAIVARGGRGGRETGIFLRDSTTTGNAGQQGGIMIVSEDPEPFAQQGS